MPRTSRALPDSARPLRAGSILSGGNGVAVESPDRLARIESLLEDIQQSLAVQFQRIAALQAQLDRAIADRPLPPATR